MRFWGIVILLASCVSHDLVLCGDKLCPIGTRCAQDQWCVSDADAQACGDKQEGDACMVTGLPGGFCTQGNCIVPVCGNSVKENGEACDDGGRVSDDGCSADCLSTETCGNGVIDLVHDEECDAGLPGLSGDGCASSCKKEHETWHDLTPRKLRARQHHQMVYDAERGEVVMFGGFDGTEPLGDTWVFTAGAWEQRLPASSPEPRWGYSMVYNSVTKRVYLFGGTNGTDVFGGTWAWDGVTWTKLSLATQPSDRFGAAMAFHPGNQITYLFGGVLANGVRAGDTWIFDGVAWDSVPTADDAIGSMALVVSPQMAYDELEGKLMLFGRTYFSSSTFSQLFELGTDGKWFDYEIQDLPWADASLAYDPLRTKLVLIAGAINNVPVSGTWEYDYNLGIFAPTTSTSARSRAAVVGTPQGLLLFGGLASDHTTRSETVLRNATGAWSSVTTTPLPLGRAGAMATFDATARRALLYGGTDVTPFNDSWFWRDALWTRGPQIGPGPRAFAGMTYDQADDETLLFGGTDGTGIAAGSNGQPTGQCASAVGTDAGLDDGGVSFDDAGVPIIPSCELSDTWTFSNGVWTREHPATAPTGRMLPAITYDAARDRVMLFGGTQGDVAFNDTWVWNRASSTWMQLAPIVVPPELQNPRMAFDRHRNVAVLYGTFVDGTETRGELWEFDGMMWIPRVTSNAPPPRNGASLIYDPRRRTTLLYGGKRPSGQLVDDTWEWNGATLAWTQKFPVQKPTPRTNAAAIYDPIRGKILLFGGQGLLGIRLDDVWAYGFESPGETVENCSDDTDNDGDTLDGCMDPDCWGDCTPTCPPGAVCH